MHGLTSRIDQEFSCFAIWESNMSSARAGVHMILYPSSSSMHGTAWQQRLLDDDDVNT
jgi:hypothetical protein